MMTAVIALGSLGCAWLAVREQDQFMLWWSGAVFGAALVMMAWEYTRAAIRAHLEKLVRSTDGDQS